MGETETNGSRKKMVNRNIAIVVGIICVVIIASLVASLVGTLNFLNSANQQNTNLLNQNQQLQAWLNQNETLLNETQDNCTNLQNIVNLNESAVLWSENGIIYTPTNSETILGLGSWQIPYAGYLLANINSTSETVVELTYIFRSQNFTSQVDCGTGGTAIFPVVPNPTNMTVRAPVNKPPAGWTANWTLTYYY
jgi:hypothetical protein